MFNTFDILMDRHEVVGWRLVLNYMRTPLSHYYLQCSEQVIYIVYMDLMQFQYNIECITFALCVQLNHDNPAMVEVFT